MENLSNALLIQNHFEEFEHKFSIPFLTFRFQYGGYSISFVAA